ncbi:hypothetical protein BD309DRAFT_195525 [Dichomitus squalens]|nr:hypothetical protein BD309DRAFT_195525 [Dichomitus squalens]
MPRNSTAVVRSGAVALCHGARPRTSRSCRLRSRTASSTSDFNSSGCPSAEGSMSVETCTTLASPTPGYQDGPRRRAGFAHCVESSLRFEQRPLQEQYTPLGYFPGTSGVAFEDTDTNHDTAQASTEDHTSNALRADAVFCSGNSAAKHFMAMRLATRERQA